MGRPFNNKRLGDILIDAHLINEEQLIEALGKQKITGKKLGEILISDGVISSEQLIEALEKLLGTPHIHIEKHKVEVEATRLISENMARRHIMIPIERKGDVLTVVMADPLNILAQEDLAIATGMRLNIAISTTEDIISAIEFYYGKQRAEKAIEEFKQEYSKFQVETEFTDEELSDINSAPIVKLVNQIISQAVKQRASDIHIEPYETLVRVRYRIDGELQEVMTPSKATQSAMVTRIKIMSKMDIAEKRIPQDGRIELELDGRDLDLRISSLPTVYGEKVVMRILNRSLEVTDKKDLGMSELNLEKYNRIMANQNGIVLVTGPTGSGKSTTLYTTLKELNKVNRNVVTVEDPVEYKLMGINQVQVNSKAGLTFASGLRSILRQDPDIVMIGEIRDGETAEIAVRAAITGHLVLSTLHTNDAPSSISRLIDMGIEPFLVSSSVVGIVAQRLVKRICPDCKTEHIMDDSDKHALNLDHGHKIYHGKGCNFCNFTGYRGRIAVFEVVEMNREIRQMINENKTVDEIRDVSRKYGTVSLKESCKQLVLSGVTTVEELVRVTYNLD